MNYYTEGDTVEVISLDGTNTERANTRVGARYRVNEVYFYSNVVKIGFNSFLDFKDIKVVQRAPVTDEVTEQRVAQKAVKNYRQAQADNKRIEDILKTKTYHLNDYVVDVNFGVGKIVGWDEEHNYYRVRFNDWMKFVGREEDILMPYEWDDVPKELADYDPSVVNYVWGFYLDDTEAEDTEG